MWYRLFCALILVGVLGACMPLPPPALPPGPEDKGETLFFEAEDLAQRQEYRQALQKYEAYLLRYPQGAKARQARLRQADLLGLVGDWHGALLKYQSLLVGDLDSDTALKARYGVGRANFKLGRYQQAQEVLESLTALDLPASLRFSTHALLAEIALKKGEVEPAFARLRLAARDMAGGDQEWLDDLKSRVVEAATPSQLEQLADLYRDSVLTAPMLLRLARLAQEQGREAEARKWLDTLKERFPESKEAQGASATLAASRPVVGCLVPLSGEYAEFGKHLEQGLLLGAQGSRFELAVRDCPNDPAAAARLVQELAQDPRVVAILGPLTSGDAHAAAQAAQAAGVPLIALSQKSDLTQAGPLIFQIFLTPRPQVRALLDYALGQRGLTRIALLAPESPYGRTLSRIFREELAARGGSLVAQTTYPPGAEDLGAALAPLAEAYKVNPFQALFVPDEAATLAAVAEAWEAQGLPRLQLLGTNLTKPGDGQEQESRYLEGLIFPDAFFAGDPDPGVQSFLTAFRQRFGQDPDYLAAQGYMAVRLLAQVWDSQGPFGRADLPARLLSMRQVPNLPWFRGFGPDRQAALALYLLTWEQGRVKLLAPPVAPAP